MSNRVNVTCLLLACVFAFALAAPALATDVISPKDGESRAFHPRKGSPNPALIAGETAKVPFTRNLAIPNTGASTAYQCITVHNQCSDPALQLYWSYNWPTNDTLSCGSFQNPFEKFDNNNFIEETLKVVRWTVYYDSDSAASEGMPDLKCWVVGDAGGLPDTTNILATVSRPWADWTADGDISSDYANQYYGDLPFDVSAFNVVIQPFKSYHVMIEVTNRMEVTGVRNRLYFFSDEADEDGFGCIGNVYHGGIFRNRSMHGDPGYDTLCPGPIRAFQWFDDLFGPENWAVSVELCAAFKPPVCSITSESCLDLGDLGNTLYACFFMPSGVSNRKGAAVNFAGTIPTSTCTLKTVTAFICDWTTTTYDTLGAIVDTGTAVDLDCIIYDGVNGSEVARLTLPAATVEANWLATTRSTWDFTSMNIVLPPGATYYAALAIDGSVKGDPGYTMGLGPGVDDPTCAGAADDYMIYVDDTLSDTSWVNITTQVFGVAYQWDINVEVCCGASYFAECTPGSELDWEAMGNGNARTNASTASISSLCGLNRAWSVDFSGNVGATQPLIVGDKVLVTSTDSLHCLDKATGAVIWEIGAFPYIVGDLRSAPTVDVGAGLVYFSGAGAQSFTCCSLSTGGVQWSRNLGGVDPPMIPLLPGQLSYTPSVLAGGVIYFTQETGNLYGLDAATGLDIAGSPLAIPGAPTAVPYHGLTSDGQKLWVGTADIIGTAGSIFQVDAATMVIDWELSNPGMIFYPAADSLYDPEGFPGSMAYEDGVLYYHSLIRKTGFPHGISTGSVGAIDVALEDGSGAGLLWVNDATTTTVAAPGINLSSYNWSGPAIGPGMVYLNSRGYLTTDLDGMAGWSKTLGVRIWYVGYTSTGNSNGIPQTDDVRGDSPVSVFCDGDTPYLFVGNVGGAWRLVNGNDGSILWERTMTGRVRGTAIADDYAVTVVRTGAPSAPAGGSVVAFAVGADRPRLQIDSLFVFRSASPGDGVAAGTVADALQNTGCLDLNIAGYGAVNPPVVRVSSVHPSLTASAKRHIGNLVGYDAFLNPPTAKELKISLLAGVDEDESESLVRSFTHSASGAADPLFLTVTEAPGIVSPGATQSIAVTYDETGLTNNTGYTNYIEVDSDDPDFYPQDPSGDSLGLPAITFTLFIGCPDAEAVMSTGLGEVWVNNFGAEAGGGNFVDLGPQNFNINGNTANMFDGGWALVVQDSVHWAWDGCSVGGYPRRAGEWGPTYTDSIAQTCGLTIVAGAYDSPLGVGADATEEVAHNMLDLTSVFGFFNPSERGAGGVYCSVQRLASQDPAFGDFVLTCMTILNEPGDFGGSGYDTIVGTMNDVYFGGVTDWDISGTDNLKAFADGYGQTDGGGPGWGNGNWICGHVRLDADIVGAGGIGSGGSPTFMAADIQNDQGHGDAAFRMLSSPATYGASVDPASTNNTDLAALWSLMHVPSLADGESVTLYFATYQVENGVNGLPWTNAAEADAAYTEIACRAKAFAGFGKGDVNCDGCVDLADVVLLGNILDGLYNPAGTGGVYTADADGDNAWTQADYDLVYDVVAGVQPASALANGWRF